MGVEGCWGQAVLQDAGAEQGVLYLCPLGLCREMSCAALETFALCFPAHGAYGCLWVWSEGPAWAGDCAGAAAAAASQVPIRRVQGPSLGVDLKGCPVPGMAVCPWAHRLVGSEGRGWHRDAGRWAVK